MGKFEGNIHCYFIFIGPFLKMSDKAENEYVFNWRIENYSAYYQEKGDKICSPVFKIENLYESLWRLEFFPKGSPSLEDGASFVSCFLTLIESNKTIKKITISYSLGIMDEKGCVLNCLEYRNTFEKNRRYGCNTFFAIKDLVQKMDEWEEDILILKCRITSDSLPKQKYAGSEGSTTIGVDRYCAEWDVKVPILTEHSESIFFPITELNQLGVTLTCNFDSVKIHFQLKEDSSDLPLRIMIKITMHDKIDFKFESKRAVHVFKTLDVWQFPDFISKELLEACKVDLSLCEFKLKCYVYISNKSISSKSIIKFKSFVSKTIPKFENALQKEFRNLFLSKQYSDVLVRSLTEEFPAHQIVLRVRSPVFAAMFDQNLLEKQTGVVDITDIDGETLKVFLEFLYTETVDKMDYNIAKKLILAGDKYQVPSLVAECAFF